VPYGQPSGELVIGSDLLVLQHPILERPSSPPLLVAVLRVSDICIDQRFRSRATAAAERDQLGGLRVRIRVALIGLKQRLDRLVGDTDVRAQTVRRVLTDTGIGVAEVTDGGRGRHAHARNPDQSDQR
jgi:hypothetical protein